MTGFYAGGINNNQAKEAASINIKNNREAGVKTGNVSFEGVFFSGMEINKDRLDKNTYESLLKETDDVKAQIMESATNAKANLKALFNRLSGADAVRIDEDGFNLNDMTQEEAVSILDKIKIELATYCEDYEITGTSVSVDKIKEVVGSDAAAQSIISKMEAAGVPATQDNIDELAESLRQLEGIDNISEEAKDYLVLNQLEPTIENVHLAEAVSTNNGAVRNKHALSEKQWEQLKPQIDFTLKNAGIEPSKKDFDNARTFILKGIPVLEDTLRYKNQLDNSKFDMESVADNIINAMAAGVSGKSALVIGKADMLNEVAKAIDVLDKVQYVHVDRAVENANSKNAPLTLRSIEEAIAMVEAEGIEDIPDRNRVEPEYSQADSDENSKNNGQGKNPSAYASYKMILEVQILLTAKSGMYLERQGISVMAESIANLHAKLKAMDQEEVMEEIATQLAEDIDSPKVAEAYRITYETRRAIFEIKRMPDVTIGAFVNEVSGSGLSIGAFAREGNLYRDRFRRASETYEAVGTSMRSDLGDSIGKAVNASAESILKDIGLEDNQANRDAVRILGFNEVEITKETVEKVKELYSTLNSLIRNMTPDACIKMIRDGINPMNEDIHNVDNYLKSSNSRGLFKSKDDDANKFSTFLYKLDQTGGITPEERKKFIGIFKMMNMFLIDAGVAIGTLYKQNADMTMGNLCQAYNSRKHSGMDLSVSDNADNKVAAGTAYYLNLFEENGKYVTPLTLKNVNEDKLIDERGVENFCEALADTYDEEAEAMYAKEYLDMVRDMANADSEVLRNIENSGEEITLNNIEAFKMLMNSAKAAELFSRNGRNPRRVLEAFNSEEEIRGVFESLNEDSDRELEDIKATAGDGENDITYDELHEKILENRQIRIMTSLARQRDYSVPVVTEEGVSMMRLTLISDSESKGRISISTETEGWGKTSLEIKVTENSMDIFGVCNKDVEDLKERLEQMAAAIKSEFDYEAVNIYTTNRASVDRITYENSSENVPTTELYGISKFIISSLF